MIPTHLSHALLAATSDTSVRALATECGISPSTLSRLISDDRRVDEETLRKLCHANPREAAGLRLLIAHLRDEIERAGRKQTEIKISTPGASADDDDILLLQEDIRTDRNLRAIIHDLAQMARAIRRKKARHEYPERPSDSDLAAAED